MSRLHDRAYERRRKSTLSIRLAAALAAMTIGLPSALAQWTAVQLPAGTGFSFMTDLAFPLPTTGYLVGWEAGNKGVILKTSNGGGEWQRTDVDQSQLFGVKFIGPDTGVVVGYDYDCKCGLVTRTVDGGKKWSPTTYPDVASFQGIESGPDNTLYASGGAGVILKSTDRGASWTKSHADAGGQYKVTQFIDASTGFAVAASGEFGLTTTVYKTTDGGTNWEVIFDEENGIAKDVFFVSPQTGFIAGDVINEDLYLPALYKTTNGGASWERIWTGTLSPTFLEDINFLTPQIGFVVGDNGTIMETTDGGKTWEPDFPPDLSGLKRIEFIDGMVYATGDLGTLISRSLDLPKPTALFSATTLDFGGVGPQQSRSLTLMISAGGVKDPLTIDTLFIAEGGEEKGFALVSPKEGGFPITIPPGASQEVKVSFAPVATGKAESNLVIRSNDGDNPEQSLKLTGTGTSTSSVAAARGAKGNTLSIRPNPVGTSGEITLHLSSGGRVAVTLYDACGRQIATLFDGQAEGGEKRLAVDCSHLNPGIYFCVVEGESGRTESAFIVEQ